MARGPKHSRKGTQTDGAQTKPRKSQTERVRLCGLIDYTRPVWKSILVSLWRKKKNTKVYREGINKCRAGSLLWRRKGFVLDTARTINEKPLLLIFSPVTAFSARLTALRWTFSWTHNLSLSFFVAFCFEITIEKNWLQFSLESCFFLFHWLVASGFIWIWYELYPQFFLS